MPRSSDSKGAAQAAPTLEELAARIREESEAGEEASLTRAIRLGEMLRQARRLTPRGGWKPWLETNFAGSQTAARLYMRIADPANQPRAVGCKSVREAEAAIAQPKPSRAPSKPKPKEAGKRLRALRARKREKDSNLLIARVDVVKMVGVLEAVDLPALGFGDAAGAASGSASEPKRRGEKMSPVPLIELQRRLTIVGAIRGGGEKPERGVGKKLEAWRITSPRRELVEQAAVLYGGAVSSWQSPVGEEWQVYTDAPVLPVLVMPSYSLRQSYELWEGATKTAPDSPALG